MRTSAVVVLVVLSASWAVTTAHADGPADLQKARELVRRGSTHYEQGNYVKAKMEFSAAFKLVRSANILFNIAQCYRKLGKHALAVIYYKSYLTEWKLKNPGKPSPFQAEVQEHITKLTAAVEEAKRAEALKRAKAQKEAEQRRLAAQLELERRRKREADEARAREREAREARARREKEARKKGDERARRGRWKHVGGWTAVGIGAAALVTGIVLGAQAKSKADEYGSAVEQRRPYEDLEAIEKQQRKLRAGAITTLVIGGVLAAGGAGLLIWDRMSKPMKPDERSSKLVWGPLAEPTPVGVTVSGRF